MKLRVTQSRPTLCDSADCSLPASSVHGDSPDKNTSVVAIPFSRGSSQPRDCTWVSCIAGRSFTVWATREASPESNLMSNEWWEFAVVELPFHKPMCQLLTPGDQYILTWYGPTVLSTPPDNPWISHHLMNDTVPGPTVRTGLNYMQFLLIILQVKYWQFHMTQADTMCSSKEEWCINYPQLKMRKLRLVEVSEWPRSPS